MGGATDGGYDDDASDDSDIWLNWRTTDFFNGERVNQYWGARIFDVSSGGEGELNYLEIKIYYVIIPSGSLYLNISNISGYNQDIPGPNGRVQLYNSAGKFITEKQTGSWAYVYIDDIPAGTGYDADIYHFPHDPSTIFGAEFWGTKGNIEITNGKTTSTDFERDQPFKLSIKVFKNGVDVTGGDLNIDEEISVTVTIKNPGSDTKYCRAQCVLDQNKTAPYDFNSKSGKNIIYGNSSKEFTFSFTPVKIGQYFSAVGTWTASWIFSESKITDGDAWYQSPLFNAIDPTKEITPALDPSPSEGAENVSINLNQLTWRASTLNGTEVSSYRVYFGTDPSPGESEFVGTTSENVWTISADLLPLRYNTQYFWKVISQEGTKSSTSQVWKFRTEKDPSKIVNKIKYDIYIWAPGTLFLNTPFKVFGGEINENTTIMVPDINLSDWFGEIATAFNTISGSAIKFDNIANEDIYVKIKFLFGNGGPRKHNDEKLFMEMWCEVFHGDNYQPYTTDFQFNEGEYVTFRLDKDQGLTNYLNEVNISSDTLAYYYLIDNGFSVEGIQTIDEEEFLTFRVFFQIPIETNRL